MCAKENDESETSEAENGDVAPAAPIQQEYSLYQSNRALFDNVPSAKSVMKGIAWSELHELAMSQDSAVDTSEPEVVTPSASDFGGFSGWDGRDGALAYPTGETIAQTLTYIPSTRMKIRRNRKNSMPQADVKSSKTKTLFEQTMANLGRHCEQRAEQRQADAWSNSTLQTQNWNSFQQNRKQLVLPKVGNHRQQQHTTSNFTSLCFQNTQNGPTLRFDRNVTPFLPPIKAYNSSKFKFQLPASFSTTNNGKSAALPVSQHNSETAAVVAAAAAATAAASSRTASSLTARWKSSIPRQLQAMTTKENVITRDKMSKNSSMSKVYRVVSNTSSDNKE